MYWLRKNFTSMITIFFCCIISTVISLFGDYSSSRIVEYSNVTNIVLTLFSVSLAIVALMITLLDKYKERKPSQSNWFATSTNILKELSENTISLLLLIIVLLVCSLFAPLVTLSTKFSISEIVLIFSLLFSFITMIDTTLSVYKLVINLKEIINVENPEKQQLSKKEEQLIEAYRFLDTEHQTTCEKLIRSLTIDQQVKD